MVEPQPRKHMRHGALDHKRFAVTREQISLDHARDEVATSRRNPLAVRVDGGIDAGREGAQVLVRVAAPRQGQTVIGKDVEQDRRGTPQGGIEARHADLHLGQPIGVRVDPAVQANPGG